MVAQQEGPRLERIPVKPNLGITDIKVLNMDPANENHPECDIWVVRILNPRQVDEKTPSFLKQGEVIALRVPKEEDKQPKRNEQKKAYRVQIAFRGDERGGGYYLIPDEPEKKIKR